MIYFIVMRCGRNCIYNKNYTIVAIIALMFYIFQALERAVVVLEQEQEEFSCQYQKVSGLWILKHLN